MKKSYIFIIGGVALVFILLFSLKDQGYKKPVDWTASYSRYDKNPYGCFILYKEWAQLFPNDTLKPINKSILDLLWTEEEEYQEEYNDAYYDEYSDDFSTATLKSIVDDWYYDYEKDDETFLTKLEELRTTTPDQFKNTNPSNFVFIAEMNSLNEADEKELLKHMIKGNTVFMAAHNFAVDFPFIYGIESRTRKEKGIDSTYLKFRDGEKHRYKRFSVNHFLNYQPHENVEVLAVNNDGSHVLIEVTYGKGRLILSSTPLAYTNYNMLLNRNHHFISKSLNRLNQQNTWWCGNYLEYGFTYNGKDTPEDNRSIMQFIHSQPPLAWAFYVLLGAILIFFAFATKRRQRLIPEYRKPINTSVEFTNTISRLYLRQKDHRDIGEKMITYFFDDIRNKYYVNPHLPKEDFFDKLSDKSGVEKNEVIAIFKYIEAFKKRTSVTELDITTLNGHIQNFKNKSH